MSSTTRTRERRWNARWLELFRLSASWNDYEDLRPARSQSLLWLQPERKVEAVLLTQKGPVFRRIAPALAELSVTTCLVPYPTPSIRVCEAIERFGRAFRAKLFWFGDLDPTGLTAFELLRSAMNPRRHSVTYIGVDDWWLKTGERERGRHVRPIEQQILEMGRQERQHLNMALDLVKGVRAIVGERSYNLLASGKKLEVEGMMTISPRFMALSPRLLAARIRRSL